MTAGAVTFSRARATFLQGDADSHAYALEAGGKTLYMWVKTTTLATQLIAGRGPLSSRLDSSLSSTGWATGFSVRANSPYFNFRAGARNESGGVYVAGGQSTSYTSTYTYNYARYFHTAFVQQGITLTNGSAAPRSVPALPYRLVLPAQWNATYQPRIGPWGIARTMACMSGYPGSFSVDCASNGESRWLTPDPTVPSPLPTWYLTDQPVLDYSTVDSVGNRQLTPAASPDDAFHLGGKNFGAADVNTALDGEIQTVLLYDEEHNASQRQEVYSFFIGTPTNPGYAWQGCDVATTNGPGVTNACPLNSAVAGFPCTQSCQSSSDPITSFYPLFGREGIRYCNAGAWNQPLLTCRKRCYGASLL